MVGKKQTIGDPKVGLFQGAVSFVHVRSAGTAGLRFLDSGILVSPISQECGNV